MLWCYACALPSVPHPKAMAAQRTVQYTRLLFIRGNRDARVRVFTVCKCSQRIEAAHPQHWLMPTAEENKRGGH